MLSYYKISECRLCHFEEFVSLFSVGEHFVNTFPARWPHDGIKCPIELVQCQNCSMLQSRYTAPNDLLYSGHYWFKSGMNKTIVNNLKSIAELAMTYMSKEDSIIDIGANDGTLLSFIKGHTRIGIEPAQNLVHSLNKNAEVVVNDFWKGWGGKVKVITAIGMFYDTEDPVKFLKLIKNSLLEDGVFITEMMTTSQMIEASDLGNLCHEHLMFYTKETIKKLFEMARLEIFSMELNPFSEDGKGYRILARHWVNGHCPMEEENTDIPKFIKTVEKAKNDMLNFLKNKGNKKVYIYGASTKANTILQYYGIGPDLIEGAIDKDPDKVGNFLLTGIPIVNESYIKKADFLWCIPYPFLDKFREKENFDGAWIVTNPDFTIYG